MGDSIAWTVHGDPPSIKNNLMFAKGGRVYHKGNEIAIYKQAFDLQTPKPFKHGIEVPVMVKVRLIRANNRKDPLNQIGTIADCLQYAGVIKNDRQIVSWEIDATEMDKKDPRVFIEVEVL